MPEIQYVALPNSPLPSLFKWRPLGPRWSCTRGSYIQTIEIIKKNQNLLLQNHFAQILKFNMKHCLMVFYQICSNGRVQNGPPQRVLGLNHRNRWKIFKNLLLQNYLPQMFEIRFVALPSGLLPSLFKPRFKGPKWPYPRGSWVWSIEIHRQYEKNLLFQNNLAQMLENWYRGLHSWALLSLLKWWPHVPKSSTALGFGFELLNSGERFRAIMALLFLFLNRNICYNL